MEYNSLIILGPTAVGKTGIGVAVANALNAEIISADSRQVYKNLDIGSGKDLKDYDIALPSGETKHIPYHLIDIVTLETEYSVFEYQQDFYKVFRELQSRCVLPVVVGGTGMYIDSVVREYDFVPCPKNEELRKWAETKTDEELAQTLIAEKKKMHNTSELKDRKTIIKAIEINRFNNSPDFEKVKATLEARPEIKPLIFGVTAERPVIRERILKRLCERFDEGMIDEVKGLNENGASWERLERLGLEYRFISQFIQGKIPTFDEMKEKLYTAICQFAKRQETWFRFMEKNGVEIHWLDKAKPNADKVKDILDFIEKDDNLQ